MVIIEQLDHIISKQKAEIERLRADLALRDETARDRKEIIRKLEAEIERLRAEKAELVIAFDHLRAEKSAIRAALHWTAQNCLDAKCAKRAMDVLMQPGDGNVDSGKH